MVTVGAILTNHRVSTFHIPALVGPSLQLREDSTLGQPDEDGDDEDAAPEYGRSQPELAKDSTEVEGGEVGNVFFTVCLAILCSRVRIQEPNGWCCPGDL